WRRFRSSSGFRGAQWLGGLLAQPFGLLFKGASNGPMAGSAGRAAKHSAQKALDFLGARHLALNDNLAIDRQGWRAHYPCVDDGVGVGDFFHVVGFVQGPGGGLGVGGELFAFGAATAVEGEFHGACLLGWGERINTSCRKRSR